MRTERAEGGEEGGAGEEAEARRVGRLGQVRLAGRLRLRPRGFLQLDPGYKDVTVAMAMLLPTPLNLPATPGTRGRGTGAGGSHDLPCGGRVSCCSTVADGA